MGRRVDAVLEHLLRLALQRAGGSVHVQPVTAVGLGRKVHVSVRVLVGWTSSPPAPASTWHALRANLRPFVAVGVSAATVSVTCADQHVRATADRDGFAAVQFQQDLPAGQSVAVVTPLDPPGPPVTVVVHVLPADTGVSVVSDIDDTIVDSGVARGLLSTLRTALLEDALQRPALPGAPELYRELASTLEGPSRPVVYISSSPWNLSEYLAGFLRRHRFPPGPFVLADWRPGHHGLSTTGTRAFKGAVLAELAAALPSCRFLLLGDSGQHDAQIYSDFALAHPTRVLAVYIRQAGDVTSAVAEHLDSCRRRLAPTGVDLVVVQDSGEVLEHARAAGLLETGAADEHL